MGKFELDQEWVQLITEARNMGIEKEVIRNFLKEKVMMSSLMKTNKERKIYE